MHTPVLLQECLSALRPEPGEFHIDGTLGAGGHAREIIARITPGGTFLGVDRDPRAVGKFSVVADNTVRIITSAASYAELPRIMAEHRLPKADGLLLDLGFSSEQVSGGDLAGRGFSFLTDEPLLMTYDDATPSLALRLSELSAPDLAVIIEQYGEERYARQIAQSIWQMTRSSGIATTGQLVAAIRAAVPAQYEHGRLHPATRTFQALRIFVNNELRELETLLARLPEMMQSGGRVAIISFHSLEDRIVKNYFREYVHGGGRSSVEAFKKSPVAYGDHAGELPNPAPALNAGGAVLGTKKPITATEDEIARNPRSRSAKLRVLEFL